MNFDINLIVRIKEIICVQIVDFRFAHYSEPHFVKIPMWVFDLLEAYQKETMNVSFNDEPKLCGLIPCPTIGIEDINEIEVF